MKSKIVSIMFALIASISLSAQTNGTCGAHLTWFYNSNNKVLTISGSGSMDNYMGDNSPWNQYRSSINTIVIGNAVTSIGDNAFKLCSNLTSITIPNSVSSIGVWAFSGCSSLTSVIIPNAVTTIGVYTFRGCSSLTSVTIPNSVTSIGEHAFYECSGLTSVTIPNSVTSIGNSAFGGCSSLTSVIIPNAVTTIGVYTFRGCSSLASVTIPNSVTTIGANVFEYCRGLTSITIPNSVTSIGDWAFNGCSSLTSITIPNSITSIGYHAFDKCSSLTTIKMMPTTPPTLDIGVFYGNASNRVFILNGCSYDNYYASNSWSNYRDALRDPTVNISLNVSSNNSQSGTVGIQQLRGHDVRCDSTAIIYATANDGYHFDHWSNGNTANPDTIMLTGDSTIMAYFICLTAASADDSRGTVSHTKLGDHLEKVTASANNGYHFDHWSNGNTANPDTIMLTGDSTIMAYFIYLTVASADDSRGTVSRTILGDRLEKVTASANNGYHFDHWSNGSTDNPCTIHLLGDSTVTAYFLIDTSYNFSAIAPTGQTLYYRITDRVSNIVSVVAPHKLNSNHFSWFDFTLPTGTLIIPDSVMYNDTIYRVTSIGVEAFIDCSGLTSVTIPETINTIGDYAFYSCSGLTSVSLMPTTPPTLGSSVYSDNASNRVFWLNGCSYDDYYASNSWSNYRNSLRESTINISINVFSDNTQYGTVGIQQLRGHDVRCDSTAVIYATNKNGYHFDHWSNGSTENPCTIHLIGDSTVTAYFERNSYSVSASVNDVSLGTITYPYGNNALYGDTLAIVAQPVDHHHVVNWSGNGILSTSIDKDTVWLNMMTDRVLLCTIAIDTLTVEVDYDLTQGNVTGGGEFVYGTPCTLVAFAYTGYTFCGWSNGITANPYIFAVMENTKLTASFERVSSIDKVTSTDVRPQKVWSNGMIYILFPDGTRYDSTGKKVE